MKFIHTYFYSVALVSVVSLSACSSSSNSHEVKPNIHTDFIAKNGEAYEKQATVNEILVQFHGCKAHQ